MKVGNGLPTVVALVDHQSISVDEPFLFSNYLCCIEQVKVIAGIRQFRHSRNLLTGNNEDVRWRFGIDISERDHMIVFVNDFSRDFPIDDSSEKRRHWWHYDR